MYVLIAYDVVNNRTERFRKLLSRYLVHEQNSVFGGNLTEAQLTKLRKEISREAVEEDSFIEVTALNRKNVSVSFLKKSAENGSLVSENNDHHAKDAIVI